MIRFWLGGSKIIHSKTSISWTEISARTSSVWLLAIKMNFLNLSATTFTLNALSIFIVLIIRMAINVANTDELKHTPIVHVKFVRLASVKTDMENDRAIVIIRMQLNSRLAAFTIGVFRCL